MVLRSIVIIIWPISDGQASAFKATFTLYLISFALEAACVLAQLNLRKSPFALYYLSKTHNEPRPLQVVDTVPDVGILDAAHIGTPSGTFISDNVST